MSNQMLTLFAVGMLAAGLVAWMALKDKDDVGAMCAMSSCRKPAPGWGLKDRSLHCDGPACAGDSVVYSL